MDTLIKDKILAVTRQGRSRAESTDWFRVATGLDYLGAAPIRGSRTGALTVDRSMSAAVATADPLKGR